jgi:hypothetical protein
MQQGIEAAAVVESNTPTGLNTISLWGKANIRLKGKGMKRCMGEIGDQNKDEKQLYDVCRLLLSAMYVDITLPPINNELNDPKEGGIEFLD